MAHSVPVDSPQLFISYHVSDGGFANRLISELDLVAHRYGLWLDEISGDERGKIADRTRTALQRAKAVVLIISNRYLASSWAASAEGSELLRLLARARFFGVVLEFPLRESSPLRSHLPIYNFGGFIKESKEKQNSRLKVVINRVEQLIRGDFNPPAAAETDTPQLTLADLSKFERSAEVKNALRRACRLAVAAPRLPPIVTPIALLFGLAEGGRVEVDYLRTPQFLWKELTARGEEVYRRVLMEEFPGLAPLDEDARRTIDSIAANVDLVTPDVLEVFEAAEIIAHDVSRKRLRTANVSDELQSEIGARHLLGALLSNPDGSTSRALSTIVGDVAALGNRFYNFIVKNLPDDDHGLWEIILTNLRLPEIPPPPKQPALQQKESVLQPTVAGFMADDWNGRDLLGIERDVNALASLVAAYKVEPPLSIGLFGDWGSGKSHFMRQMRKRVELLSARARNSGKSQNELGYYKNIVQIEFNAWHYIEGNLWASLVDHIFANLRLSEQEDPSYAEQRRDELMQRIGVKEDIQKKINSRVEEREGELRKLEERKQQAEADRDTATTQLEGFKEEAISSLEKLDVPVAFTAEEKELLGRIGIDAGTNISAADVRRNYLKMKSSWNGLKARLQLFITDPSAKRRYLFSVLLALIPIAGALLVNFKNFPGLPTTVATVLGFVATFYVAAKPAWDQFRKSLSALEKHDEEVERKRQQRITQLESEVRSLTREIVDARLEGEAVGKEVERLKADIESTSSSRILAEFIEDRAAASDYRRHLGLLALIRRDFEKLRVLFAEQRKEEVDGKDITDEKKINRIVLYIDDLDRCPPDRVVQVLQAIHLLLAFPLFVVVVGVDSRWITRSLQQNYEWLGENDGEMSNGDQKEGGQDRDDDRSSGAGATPHDYLEKIFQIPFWLRSMDHDACVEFLDGLTKDSTDNGGAQLSHKAEQQVSRIEQIEPVLEDVANAETTLQTSVVSVEQPIAPIDGDPIQSAASFVSVREVNTQSVLDLAPRSLTFTSFEIDYMKELVPLIGRSPRAVKRFLNCYRLIKVGLAPAEFESFVGDNGESPSYKAAMILLGVIVGAPTVSSQVIDLLKVWKARTSVVDTFADALESNAEFRRQPDSNRVIGFFLNHDFRTSDDPLFNELIKSEEKVSRFSFRVNRSDVHPALRRAGQS